MSFQIQMFQLNELIKQPTEFPVDRLNLDTQKRILLSFSGGRTSAYMTYHLLRQLPADVEARVIFANTGQEHEETLRFVDNCDRHLGFNTTWIEAVANLEKGIGVGAKVVTFETASRDGAPFEGMIKKYGIPNQAMPQCTRELKYNPIKAYLRDNGWKTNSYQTAIGIRFDEFDRMSPTAHKRKVIYPLIKWKVTKEIVLAFWQQQAFDLRLPEHLGNCTWCWKKSLRKHLTLARNHPDVFDFPRRMEKQYPHNGAGKTGEPKRFFRGQRTVDDIFQMAKKPFEEFEDPNFDLHDGCAESCEVFE